MPRAFLRGLWGELLIVSVIIAGLALEARCTTTSKKHENAFGIQMYFENPFTYKMGSVIGAEIVLSERHRYPATSIRIAPSYTYSSFDENLLFCGNESEAFTNPETGKVWQGPLVLTYRTRASRMIDGVACHDLERIDRVKEKELR